MAKDDTGKRSWFARHKVLTGLLILLVIGGIAGATGGGNSSSSNGVEGKASNETKTYRFTDRADKQKGDVETLPGETATVGGIKMTLTNVEYKTQLSEFETADAGKTYMTADVALENTSDKTEAYNVFDFRIQTAGGQVLDGAISSIQTLSSGDMVAGGKASGKIVFEVPVEDGHQYVIWKPNAVRSDRAIVQVK